MRHLAIILAFIGVTSFAALSNVAEASPSSHDIMIKLSAEELTSSAFGCGTVSIPKGWSVLKDSEKRAQFKVPYHAGIMGVIECRDQVSSLEQDVKSLAEMFKSELTIEDSGAFDSGVISGTKAVVKGRLGGELWSLIVFSGRVTGGESIMFYVAVPTNWYAAYDMIVSGILQSFTKR